MKITQTKETKLHCRIYMERYNLEEYIRQTMLRKIEAVTGHKIPAGTVVSMPDDVLKPGAWTVTLTLNEDK